MKCSEPSLFMHQKSKNEQQNYWHEMALWIQPYYQNFRSLLVLMLFTKEHYNYVNRKCLKYLIWGEKSLSKVKAKGFFLTATVTGERNEQQGSGSNWSLFGHGLRAPPKSKVSGKKPSSPSKGHGILSHNFIRVLKNQSSLFTGKFQQFLSQQNQCRGRGAWNSPG